MIGRRIAAALFVVAASFAAFPAAANAATGGGDDDKPGRCSAYRWADAQSGTICEQFPGDKVRHCPEIGKPVVLRFGELVDPWRLDTNDKDVIGCEIEVSPSPSTSQSSSASPSPSTSTSATPTQSTSPTATTEPTETADSTPTAAGAADDSPSLPKTGAPIGTVAIAAGAVVALGLAAVIVFRRRTTRFEG